MKKLFLTICWLVLILPAKDSFASVIDTWFSVNSPYFLQVPPSSVIPGALESNDRVYGIFEKTNYILPTDVMVDMTMPGKSIGSGSPSPGIIVAGTYVDSYLLHFDPTADQSTNICVEWFDHVFGVILTSEKLNLSDPVLGLNSVNYPISDNQRGFEDNDSLGFSNPITAPYWDYFSLDLNEDTGIDQIRIIREPMGFLIPIPSAVWLLGSGLIGLVGVRRKFRKN